MKQQTEAKQANFGERVIDFLENLHFDAALPKGVDVLNPYLPDTETMQLTSSFYRKFYNDNAKRVLILGINPGRLGAGATGIPFTDSKRLISHCKMESSFALHEPSSVFVYKVIDAFGTTEEFYKKVFISSVSPLGFVKENAKGKLVNYNYYDSAALEKCVRPFIVSSLKQVIELGVYTNTVLCLGTGKNYTYLNKLNEQLQLFGNIIALEHPRYVMQYKSKSMHTYIDKYITALDAAVSE